MNIGNIIATLLGLATIWVFLVDGQIFLGLILLALTLVVWMNS